MDLVVGIDLSATNLQFGVVDARNAITGRARAKTEADKGQGQVIANVLKGVTAACDEAGVTPNDIAAVGVVAAGAIDMPRGVIIEAPNLGWKDVALRDLLAKELGKPVVLDNDVNGAVWGEYHLGAGKGRGDVLGVWVGTGVGGGLILNGAIYHGDAFTAGEIGHMVIEPDGIEGARTIEDLCSRSGILRALGKTLDTEQIGNAYRAGDLKLCELIDRGADLLGITIANWVTVLSLQTVIIGGGMTEALGRPYVDAIRDSFRRDVYPDELQSCELVVTELAADSGLLGAALLARDAP